MLLLLRNDVILESVDIFVNGKDNLPLIYLGLIITC